MTLCVFLLLCVSVAAQDEIIATDSKSQVVEEHQSNSSKESAFLLFKHGRNQLPFAIFQNSPHSGSKYDFYSDDHSAITSQENMAYSGTENKYLNMIGDHLGVQSNEYPSVTENHLGVQNNKYPSTIQNHFSVQNNNAFIEKERMKSIAKENFASFLTKDDSQKTNTVISTLSNSLPVSEIKNVPSSLGNNFSLNRNWLSFLSRNSGYDPRIISSLFQRLGLQKSKFHPKIVNNLFSSSNFRPVSSNRCQCGLQTHTKNNFDFTRSNYFNSLSKNLFTSKHAGLNFSQIFPFLNRAVFMPPKNPLYSSKGDVALPHNKTFIILKTVFLRCCNDLQNIRRSSLPKNFYVLLNRVLPVLRSYKALSSRLIPLENLAHISSRNDLPFHSYNSFSLRSENPYVLSSNDWLNKFILSGSRYPLSLNYVSSTLHEPFLPLSLHYQVQLKPCNSYPAVRSNNHVLLPSPSLVNQQTSDDLPPKSLYSFSPNHYSLLPSDNSDFFLINTENPTTENIVFSSHSLDNYVPLPLQKIAALKLIKPFSAPSSSSHFHTPQDNSFSFPTSNVSPRMLRNSPPLDDLHIKADLSNFPLLPLDNSIVYPLNNFYSTPSSDNPQSFPSSNLSFFPSANHRLDNSLYRGRPVPLDNTQVSPFSSVRSSLPPGHLFFPLVNFISNPSSSNSFPFSLENSVQVNNLNPYSLLHHVFPFLSDNLPTANLSPLSDTPVLPFLSSNDVSSFYSDETVPTSNSHSVSSLKSYSSSPLNRPQTLQFSESHLPLSSDNFFLDSAGDFSISSSENASSLDSASVLDNASSFLSDSSVSTNHLHSLSPSNAFSSFPLSGPHVLQLNELNPFLQTTNSHSVASGNLNKVFPFFQDYPLSVTHSHPASQSNSFLPLPVSNTQPIPLNDLYHHPLWRKPFYYAKDVFSSPLDNIPFFTSANPTSTNHLQPLPASNDFSSLPLANSHALQLNYLYPPSALENSFPHPERNYLSLPSSNFSLSSSNNLTGTNNLQFTQSPSNFSSSLVDDFLTIQSNNAHPSSLRDNYFLALSNIFPFLSNSSFRLNNPQFVASSTYPSSGLSDNFNLLQLKDLYSPSWSSNPAVHQTDNVLPSSDNINPVTASNNVSPLFIDNYQTLWPKNLYAFPPYDNSILHSSGNFYPYSSNNYLPVALPDDNENKVNNFYPSSQSDRLSLHLLHNPSSPSLNPLFLRLDDPAAPSDSENFLPLDNTSPSSPQLYHNRNNLKAESLDSALSYKARYSPSDYVRGAIKDISAHANVHQNSHGSENESDWKVHGYASQNDAFYSEEKDDKDVGNRIMGGCAARPGEIPYQVALYKVDIFQCGSSLISEYYILTAGHCLEGTLPSELWVRVGSNSLMKGGQIYKVADYVIHGDYSNDDYDIGLIRTTRAVKFSRYIQAIQLPSVDDPPLLANTPVETSGWGATKLENGAVPSYSLHKINLKITSRKRCRNRIMASARIITNRQICTTAPVRAGTCFGDSGGPLVANGKLVGIVSWGSPCAIGDPDVYTKVQEFVPWIHAKMIKVGQF